MIEVLAKDWYHAPDEVLTKIERLVNRPEEEIEEVCGAEEELGEAPVVAVEGTGIRYSDSIVEIARDTQALKVAEEEPESANDDDKPEAYLEYVDERSHKFWELTRTGSSYTVRFGRVGTQGQSRTKEFETEAQAKTEAQKQIGAKIRKGYEAAD